MDNGSLYCEIVNVNGRRVGEHKVTAEGREKARRQDVANKRWKQKKREARAAIVPKPVMGRPVWEAALRGKPSLATSVAKSVLEDDFMNYAADDTDTGKLLYQLARAVVEERKQYLKTGRW